MAREESLLIFEDNPYGRFAFDADPAPTLKSMDDPNDPVVIYLGSFAKTLYPGLRLGYMVADQHLTATDVASESTDGGVLLAQELSKIKSLTTVNTSLGCFLIGWAFGKDGAIVSILDHLATFVVTASLRCCGL